MIKKYTYKEFNTRIGILTRQYNQYRNILVCGIATGGIIPAYKLSNSIQASYKTIRPNQPLPERNI